MRAKAWARLRAAPSPRPRAVGTRPASVNWPPTQTVAARMWIDNRMPSRAGARAAGPTVFILLLLPLPLGLALLGEGDGTLHGVGRGEDHPDGLVVQGPTLGLAHAGRAHHHFLRPAHGQ